MTTTTETGASSKPAKKVAHLTPKQRSLLGKEARARVPRASHADFEPAHDRPDPVSLLERQAVSRVPELVPIRYGRMLVSPFTFYRGAALIMASDLARTPASGLTTQVCGDAHLSQLRTVRLARALDDVRRQRLRRDAARALGVGPQASCGQRRHRRARDQSFSKKDCASQRRRSGRRTGRRCVGWPSRATSTCGTPTSTSRRSSPASRPRPAGRSRRRRRRRQRRWRPRRRPSWRSRAPRTRSRPRTS